MKSAAVSRTHQRPASLPMRIVLSYRLPSWNCILSLSLRDRMRAKREAQAALASALKADVADFVTRTTYP